MTPVEIHLVAGTRPNFMKVAPVYHVLKDEDWCTPVLVHTGQHYDPAMSAAFLADLALPEPDVQLNVGSGSHAQQTAAVMVAYEEVCLGQRPDWTIVVGDVNSTLAAALVAAKLRIPLAHLEAGLRSRDRSMPEEINRMVTDAIADLLWTPSADADANLRAEGIPDARIVQVGNIMIDSYEMLRGRIDAAHAFRRFALEPGAYGVVTLHRPANVDDPATLRILVDQLIACARDIALVFPVHPRTRRSLDASGLAQPLMAPHQVHVTDPLGYIDFMSLVSSARFVITDSGGIQEETTYLGIPCITVRETTERPITVAEGTNRLVQAHGIQAAVEAALSGDWPRGTRPQLWDGKTATRVARSLQEHVLRARAG